MLTAQMIVGNWILADKSIIWRSMVAILEVIETSFYFWGNPSISLSQGKLYYDVVNHKIGQAKKRKSSDSNTEE